MKRIIPLAIAGTIAVLAVALTPVTTPTNDTRWTAPHTQSGHVMPPDDDTPTYATPAATTSPAASPQPTQLNLPAPAVAQMPALADPNAVNDAASKYDALLKQYPGITPPACSGYVGSGVGNPCP